MDRSLSEFLTMLELRGRTWCIVELCGSAGFSVAPHDGVSFYAVLHGTVRLAGIGQDAATLQPGAVRAMLAREGHALRTEADSPARLLDFLREEQPVDMPPVLRIGTGPVAARVLCARLGVVWPGELRRMSMPAMLDLNAADIGPATAAMRLETLRGFAAGPGAAALLTRFASLLFGIALRNHPQCPLLFRLPAATDPIARALQLVAAEPATDWSVGSLAQRVGMSRSSFSARFAAEVGRTPMDVIAERRMLHAAEILEREDLKIVEVSARAGYRSEAAFSRRFTRHFGISPSAMRQEARRRDDPAAGDALWQALAATARPRPARTP